MNKICIIVVFYNPTEHQKQQAILLSQDSFVIVVDNSSYNCLLNDESPNLMYFALCENKGIAYAQNYGIREAQKLGYKYILFQDQDSSLSYHQVLQLYAEYQRIKSIDNTIGAIGPIILNENTGKPYKCDLDSDDYSAVSTIISSGMLVEMCTLENVGLMEEELFIDNVDHEWCWRAHNKGYAVYMTQRVALCHNVGLRTKRIGPLQIIKSSPVRSYYKFRNNLKLFSRSYVPFMWKVKTIGYMIIEFLLYVLNCKEYGRDYIKNASRGIRDALYFEK